MGIKKLLKKRKAKRVGVARLKAPGGTVLELDLIPPRDSIIRYPDGLTFVVVRRTGYMIRGHILRVYLYNGTLTYEGDVIRFSSPLKGLLRRRYKDVQKSL